MQFDIIIKNGRVIDGTGRPGFNSDIGIKDGRIERIGMIHETGGAEVIDAADQIVCPGFIELHTHYDPQICWDRSVSPAAEHGVTTVIMGNCGLSLAPVKPGFGSRITRMFNKIEDIEPAFFDAAVPYSWESFKDYLDYFADELAINVGAAVGHSVLRHYVMGDDAQTRAATEDEVEQMCEVLGHAIDAGAFGLSMSFEHITDDHDIPMASSFAERRERVALARTLVGKGRLYVQASLDSYDLDRKLQEYDELAAIALESGACCTALALMDMPNHPNQVQTELSKLQDLRDRGARIFGQTMTRPLGFSFRLTKALSLFYLAPKWSEIMILPVEERKEALSNEKIWAELGEALVEYTRGRGIGHFKVQRVVNEANRQFEGMYLRDIAASEHTSPVEAMLRIARSEDFETMFENGAAVHGDTDVVAMLLDHPLVQMGGSDSGAHVAQFAGAGDSTYLLQHFVRETGKLTLERAIQRMTSDLANDFGIRGRGCIAMGNHADIVVFDPARVERCEEIVLNDLPGSGERMIRHAKGIAAVLVNGRLVLENGEYTGTRSGCII